MPRKKKQPPPPRKHPIDSVIAGYRLQEDALNRQIQDLENKIEDLGEQEVLRAWELLEEFQVERRPEDPVYLVLGGYSCDNPVGCCVYNHEDDPAHDACLYCRLPEERK